MKAFVTRKWWRQLFAEAKQEQQAQAQAAGGDGIAFAWRAHIARKKLRAARQSHVIKCRALAAVVVQRSIKCHAARVELRSAAAAAAARRSESELRRTMVYEVRNSDHWHLQQQHQHQHERQYLVVAICDAALAGC